MKQIEGAARAEAMARLGRLNEARIEEIVSVTEVWRALAAVNGHVVPTAKIIDLLIKAHETVAYRHTATIEELRAVTDLLLSVEVREVRPKRRRKLPLNVVTLADYRRRASYDPGPPAA